jgi:Reverse transcriptase (RNA-dependent DNA polymerase).
VILNQLYFQYNDKCFKPTKGTAMGSPISSTLAEIYLQFFEELTIRHWIENGEMSYYRRYVDYIIIFDYSKINEEQITNYMNSIHKYLEFKFTEEENKNVAYLYPSIHRNNNDLHQCSDRTPTQTDTTIHFTSNHP